MLKCDKPKLRNIETKHHQKYLFKDDLEEEIRRIKVGNGWRGGHVSQQNHHAVLAKQVTRQLSVELLKENSAEDSKSSISQRLPQPHISTPRAVQRKSR